MLKNLNSADGTRTDEEIRADNEAKYKEQIEKEFAEKQSFEQRSEQFGSALYVRLPITVEAYQWFFGMENAPGVMPSKSGWGVQTHNGFVNIKDGDYIIRDVAGRYYPCEPNIFKQTYEIAE